jgi:hypothetical protein
MIRGCAAVAQLDRVLGYEPRGRGFDSCQPHQKNKKWINSLGASAPWLFFFVGAGLPNQHALVTVRSPFAVCFQDEEWDEHPEFLGLVSPAPSSGSPAAPKAQDPPSELCRFIM